MFSILILLIFDFDDFVQIRWFSILGRWTHPVFPAVMIYLSKKKSCENLWTKGNWKFPELYLRKLMNIVSHIKLPSSAATIFCLLDNKAYFFGNLFSWINLVMSGIMAQKCHKVIQVAFFWFDFYNQKMKARLFRKK